MRRLAAVLLVLILAGACAPGDPAATLAPTGIPATGQVAAIDLPLLAGTRDDARAGAAAVNAFGFDAYRELVAADPDADLVFSPTSIALALAMARPGARGTTADEMDAVLHEFGGDDEPAWVAALSEALNARTAEFRDVLDEPQQVTLRNVHAAFAQQGLELERAYLEALAVRFGAGLRLVDYVHAAEDARLQINEWVADQTEDRIEELLDDGSLDDMTRLVLVNAIYLKAAWLVPFEQEATRPAPFTMLDGTTTNVEMMRANAGIGYASGDGWRAVELPYVGEQLAMVVIEPDDLVRFEETLDGEAFDAIVAALDDRQVDLGMPRFGVETSVELQDLLARLGMPTAFTVHADFSGMTGKRELYIDKVVHQANIDVDEAGTEAAAATAVVMREVSAAPEAVELTVDRPFLYALRDRITGAILFLGRVTEPAER